MIAMLNILNKIAPSRIFTKTTCYIRVRLKTTMVEKFKFTDYDCIGFDLDNTLARYKISNMMELEYNIISNYLVNRKGYRKDHLIKPVDHSFTLKGLILDSDNGNILRIAPDGTILQASHGTRWLSSEDILEYYPNRHWKLTDMFVEDPMQTWNGPNSEKIRSLLDYYDTICSLVFARAVDTVDEDAGTRHQQYNIYPDILECLLYMFQGTHFSQNYGEYFPALKANPENYYHKCSDTLLNWLNTLKAKGKRLFLVTGSHTDFASHTAKNTIGENWRDYFDIVVTFAKKPGFFTFNRPFLTVTGTHEDSTPVSFKDLKLGGIYSQGNWEELKSFMKHQSNTSDPKVLYIGDNLIQDVYTPKVYSNCDSVAVCEELEVEMKGQFGNRWHPDEEALRSAIWGSYLRCKDTNRVVNWYHMMTTYSRLCVPSLEYVATFPVDYEFCNKC